VITTWDELEGSRRERGHIAATWTPLSGPNAITVGVDRVRIDPGMWSTPLHLEGSDEELFVVLDGSGTLELFPSARGSQGYTTAPESHPVGAGSTVVRPAATRVAHAFRAGPEGLTLLAYGTRDSNDIAYYPRSNKLYLRGVGVLARVELLDYWDGED
jgi:uncharacterized cupin superfamily protein